MPLYPWSRDAAVRARANELEPAPLIPRIFVTVPATADPVTAADLAALLKLDGQDEAAILTRFIAAATRLAEAFTKRAFMQRTVELWIDDFPTSRFIPLPQAPIGSVASVEYYADGDATRSTFAAAGYIVDSKSSPGRLVLENGYDWPTDLRAANGVVITMVVGYGAATDVPDGIKQGILAIAAEGYQAQGRQVSASDYEPKMLITHDAALFLEPYRVIR